MRLLLLISILSLAFSCKDKRSEPEKIRKNSITAIDSSKANFKVDTSHGKIIRLTSNYSFTTFKVDLFKGRSAEPNFKGNQFAKDRDYRQFIKEGCRNNGINFAGHYTIIQKACG